MNNKLIFIVIFWAFLRKTIGQKQTFLSSQIESLGSNFNTDMQNFGFNRMLKLLAPELMTTILDTINNGQNDELDKTLNKLMRKYPDISQDCRQNMVDLIKSLLLGPEGWGWQIVDANGKFPPGFMKINWVWTGDYYQCVNIKVNRTQITTSKPISGRYCLAKVLLPIFPENAVKLAIDSKSIAGFNLGTCFPTSCSPKDVQLIYDYTFGTKLKMYVDEDYCSTNEGPKMDAVAIILTILVSIPIILVVLTTIAEHFQQKRSQPLPLSISVSSKQRSLWQSVCYIFSGKSSYASLVPSTTLISGENAITCLYGIRISLMILVIWCHVYTLRYQEFPWKNTADYVFILNNPRLHYCAQSFAIMQIFFLMRMMPLYLYTAAFNAGPFYYLSNGPMWASAKVMQIACRNNWMRRFLNFENYFHLHHFENDCVTGEYFFGVDWQLYLLAVPMVWLLLRKPRGALAIIITVIISLTIVLALMVIFIENFHLFYYVPLKDDEHQSPGRTDHPMVLQVYLGFWSRLSGFGMGMLAGYFLTRYGNKTKISNRLYTFGWILFWVTNIMCELYGRTYFQAHHMPKFLMAFYSLFSNIMYPATWSFFIIYCIQFPTSFANKFLSLKIFQILGKITFPMYIVQISVLFWYYSSAIEPGILDYYTKVYDFVIITIVCIIISFILHFAIESPLDRFLKLIKGKSKVVKKSGD